MENRPQSGWIGSPKIDLVFLSFGWIPLLLIFIACDYFGVTRVSDTFLRTGVLLVSFLHRHATFPLVYGDTEVYGRHRHAYTWLPLFFLAVTLASIFYVKPAQVVTDELPQALHFQKGEYQQVFIYRNGTKIKKRVLFSGNEKSIHDVAGLFNQHLKPDVTVIPVGGSLQFNLESSKGNNWLLFPNEKSKKSLQQRLGLENRAGKKIQKTRPLFSVLLIVSVLWNMFHTIKQKVGILRIYSRKGGYGKGALDRGILYSWFVFLFFLLGSLPAVQEEAAGLASSGRLLVSLLDSFFHVFPYLALGSLMVALIFTGAYLKNEIANKHQFQGPKNLFLLSVLMLYAVFSYDFFVGYVVFGFSHAVEYLAFVAVHSKRKYGEKPKESSVMARLIQQNVWRVGSCILLISFFFLTWRYFSKQTLAWYIVGSSFLHFIYDGWIWKVRDPKVGRPLGIQYS